MNKKHTFIDLFSGCGGLSLGFEMAGFESLIAIDHWQDALKTYAYNRPGAKTLCADLLALTPQEVEEAIQTNNVDVIIGGPPCQGFSVAGKRIIEDERNQLYKRFVAMVAHFQPKAFVMENVPNILSMGEGVIKKAILDDFEALGYNVQCKVLTASNYGVPQNRRRAVFVGLKNGEFDFNLPEVEHKVTTGEALSDLPECSMTDGDKYMVEPQNDYQKFIRANSSGVFNHETTEHNQKTKDIINLVPDGGNYKDLPESLQGIRKVHIAWTRLNSKAPSITIDTGHRHHFHYKWNRVPTVRESARIQSFPDTFVFTCSKTSQYKQVGNAVPPLMANAIAKHLKETLWPSKK